MAELTARLVTHRGTLRASGFLFESEVIGEGEARRRILALWQTKARVYGLKDGLLLLLHNPLLISTEEAIGTPFVYHEGFFLGAPVSAKEMRDLQAPFGSLVRVRGGTITFETLDENLLQKPENWIDTSGFEIVQGESLGAVPNKPALDAQPEVLDLREKLGGLPKPPAELNELLALLKTGKAPQRNPDASGFLRFSFRRVPGSVREWFRMLATLWPRITDQSESLTGAKRSVFATRPVSRLSIWLNSLVMRLARVSRFARVLGWRQGRYLSRVMDMFERGDMDEALRHAIPLSSIADSPIMRVSFGVPGIRQSLRINPAGRRSSSTIPLGQSLYSHLNQLYRSTFRRLEAQGRIEEAAFVLAELLRANEEAVAFLERHGKLRQAAEIAEARELAPEIVIRQWFVAGERQRAIRIARKTGAFHGAVLRLEKSHHPSAPDLRKLWAQSLAEAGNFALATDALWPLENERIHAVDWMRLAVDAGGKPGARALARLVGEARIDFPEWKSRASTLLEDDSPESASSRLEFAETLRKQSKCPETQTLARLAARAMLRDAGRGLPPLAPIPLRQLADFSGDGALRADIPTRQPGRKIELQDLSAPREYLVSADDCGSEQLFDAALLPNGRSLVALGECGMKLITREGRTIAHFDQPANRIVVSDSGSRAIALAHRGDSWHLSRVDLQSRRAGRWCDAEISHFAPSFDGSVWYLVSGQDVYAIDAGAPGLDALWRIPGVGRVVGPLTTTPSTMSLITFQDNNFWLWDYQLPQMRLKNKHPLAFSRALESVMRLRLLSCPDSGVLDASTVFPASQDAKGKVPLDQAQQILFRKNNREWIELLRLQSDEQVASDPVLAGHWFVVSTISQARTRILLFQLANANLPVIRLSVEIEGPAKASVRLDSGNLVIADDFGRLLVFELTYGERIRDIRQ
jgi:hypothetical protein